MAAPITILLAEDDAEDRMLVEEAWQQSRIVNDLRFVKDGEELMKYLRRQGKYADEREYPTPGLILLDLNMPRMSGREALREIKADPRLRAIPVIVLTSSVAEEDIASSYELGVSSYIAKPVTFDKLVCVLQTIGEYWFTIVNLPGQKGPIDPDPGGEQ